MLLDMDAVMCRLEEKRKVFVSEADFQFSLAWVIAELYPDYKIRMEYCPSFDRRMHIDILVMTDDGWIPIELKYKTKGGTLTDNGETFILAEQFAKDVSCYMFLEDVARIEKVKQNAPHFAEGYAVLLTNATTYLTAPGKKNCVYAPFSLHNGASKTGTMCWPAHTGAGTMRGHEAPITLRGQYDLNWQSFSTLDDTDAGSFFYLVCCVE